MLAGFRSWARLGALLCVLGCAALAIPSFAQGPRLIARITEPFQVGDRIVKPGTLTVKPVSGYQPGGSIDELWIGTEFLGLFVADGTPNDASAKHDAFLFERDAQGRLVLVGYVVHGSRSDTAFRYRAVPAVSDLETALPGGAQRERGTATR
jgi:hypothetical protein